MSEGSWRGRAVALSLLALVAAAPAGAVDVLLGGRVGIYTKRGQPYFGAEAVVPVGGSIALNPNFEYVRLGDSQELSYNLDVHYEFSLKGRARGWGGVGVGLLSVHPDGPAEPNTKDGVGNVFLGVGLETGLGIPYLTAKYVARQRPEFLLALGMRF